MRRAPKPDDTEAAVIEQVYALEIARLVQQYRRPNSTIRVPLGLIGLAFLATIGAVVYFR
jgi:hypothetical protein